MKTMTSNNRFIYKVGTIYIPVDRQKDGEIRDPCAASASEGLSQLQTPNETLSFTETSKFTEEIQPPKNVERRDVFFSTRKLKGKPFYFSESGNRILVIDTSRIIYDDNKDPQSRRKARDAYLHDKDKFDVEQLAKETNEMKCVERWVTERLTVPEFLLNRRRKAKEQVNNGSDGTEPFVSVKKTLADFDEQDIKVGSILLTRVSSPGSEEGGLGFKVCSFHQNSVEMKNQQKFLPSLNAEVSDDTKITAVLSPQKHKSEPQRTGEVSCAATLVVFAEEKLAGNCFMREGGGCQSSVSMEVKEILSIDVKSVDFGKKKERKCELTPFLHVETPHSAIHVDNEDLVEMKSKNHSAIELPTTIMCTNSKSSDKAAGKLAENNGRTRTATSSHFQKQSNPERRDVFLDRKRGGKVYYYLTLSGNKVLIFDNSRIDFSPKFNHLKAQKVDFWGDFIKECNPKE